MHVVFFLTQEIIFWSKLLSKCLFRDLKLENWLLADDSEIAKLKLIDFGFSRIFKDGVRTPHVFFCGFFVHGD